MAMQKRYCFPFRESNTFLKYRNNPMFLDGAMLLQGKAGVSVLSQLSFLNSDRIVSQFLPFCKIYCSGSTDRASSQTLRQGKQFRKGSFSSCPEIDFNLPGKG